MPNFNTQSFVVYIKEDGTLDPYMWAGRKAQLAEIVSSYGDVTPTNAFNPRGGVENDGILLSEPSAPTSTLTLKAEQFSKNRSMFLGSLFNYDRRAHIDGVDRDAPNKWVDIERMIGSYATTRTTPKTSSEAQEEALVTIPVSGRVTVDIYRTVFSQHAIDGLTLPIIDTIVSDPITLSNKKASVYAVSGDALEVADNVILFNDYNGNNANWTLKSLTGITDMPQAIIGYGNFVGIAHTNDFVRSDSYGDSVSIVTPDSWVGETISGLFGLDQTMIFACGENGFISFSKDGGRNWTTSLEGGSVTTETLIGGGVLDNRVVYAYGETGTILLSLDAGESWFTPTLTGLTATPNILSMSMMTRKNFIFVTATGAIYSSLDGGETCEQQTPVEGLPTAVYTHADIEYDVSDTAVLSISSGEHSYFFRNVYGGASGYWYTVKEGDAITDTLSTGMTMLGTNNILVVGGNVAGDDNVISNIK